MSAIIEYRPVSALAIVSLSFAAIAVLGVVFPEAAFVAIPGVLAGIVGLRGIRRYQHGGRTVARVGIAACLLVFVLTQSWHFVLYSSEAAPGATRLDFQAVGTSKDRGFGQHLGQLVCIKGYPISNGRVFVMWAKRGTGNFGYRNESPAMLVFLSPDATWNWSGWNGEPVAVSGTLEVNPHRDDPVNPEYCLRRATVRRCGSLCGVVP